ncbi:hypothetical protein [Candidatus Tisiphia endosymbiont of Nemotelus uliginosus]|uniref:hypothetical protein n=1 Tax=Candidatus Tisiphia endosymbiont of Nemotelus uliginosus TaxID=3077926 RepID=UPI0035C8A2CC
MDRDVININKELLKIIEKGELTANLQLSLIKFQGMTTKAAKHFFRIIIETGIIDNEQLIDILYNNKTFPLLRATPENIKIYDYSKIDQYIKWGYFIYINDKQNIILAINDITYLRP